MLIIQIQIYLFFNSSNVFPPRYALEINRIKIFITPKIRLLDEVQKKSQKEHC
jgi:hypothetical protein